MVTGSGHLRSRPPKVAEAPVSYAVSALLLASAFVALLWVPTYAHVKPSIGGLPFFYWYSMLWLVINALCQLIAYHLLVTVPRRRRASMTTVGGRP